MREFKDPLPIKNAPTDDQIRLKKCEEGISELVTELIKLKFKISAVEEKTSRISVDEEKGALRICNRTYLFEPVKRDPPTERAWVIAEGSGPAKIVALDDVPLAQRNSAFLGGSESGFGWGNDLNQALLFRRLEDALAMISALRLKEAHPEEYPFLLPIPLTLRSTHYDRKV